MRTCSHIHISTRLSCPCAGIVPEFVLASQRLYTIVASCDLPSFTLPIPLPVFLRLSIVLLCECLTCPSVRPPSTVLKQQPLTWLYGTTDQHTHAITAELAVSCVAPWGKLNAKLTDTHRTAVNGTRPPETMIPETLCLNDVCACVTETLHPKHFLFRDAFLVQEVRICPFAPPGNYSKGAGGLFPRKSDLRVMVFIQLPYSQ